jgi:hypothetical protein
VAASSGGAPYTFLLIFRGMSPGTGGNPNTYGPPGQLWVTIPGVSGPGGN